jgi:hypothetical protein
MQQDQYTSQWDLKTSYYPLSLSHTRSLLIIAQDDIISDFEQALSEL